jgi:hypothetical protein
VLKEKFDSFLKNSPDVKGSMNEEEKSKTKELVD